MVKVIVTGGWGERGRGFLADHVAYPQLVGLDEKGAPFCYRGASRFGEEVANWPMVRDGESVEVVGVGVFTVRTHGWLEACELVPAEARSKTSKERALELVRLLLQGCGDSSCAFERGPKTGMRTNGGCRCHERVEEALEDAKQEVR